MSAVPAASVVPGVSAVHRLIGLLFALLSLFALLQPVSADAGDTIAALIGVGRPHTLIALFNCLPSLCPSLTVRCVPAVVLCC